MYIYIHTYCPDAKHFLHRTPKLAPANLPPATAVCDQELCQGLGVSKDMEQKWWNVLKNRCLALLK